MIIIICRFITYHRAFDNTLLPEKNKNRSNARCHFAAAVEAEEILRISCEDRAESSVIYLKYAALLDKVNGAISQDVTKIFFLLQRYIFLRIIIKIIWACTTRSDISHEVFWFATCLYKSIIEIMNCRDSYFNLAHCHNKQSADNHAARLIFT